MRNVPGVGLYFAILEGTRPNIEKIIPQTDAANAITAAVSRASAGMVLMPFTVLKTRRESAKYGFQGNLLIAKNLFKADGVRGITIYPTFLNYY